ncbi:MAG: helix-hairpin-helix domain-containing protein [Spirochaetes bacterium]|nr:helix-hairpin-helix domain-containing protein [Spirochaetota bacterium]
MIARLYPLLLRAYGPQGWWPLASMAGHRGFDSRGYHPGSFSFPRTPAQRFEIAVGAVLTQNTSWGNVEKALAALASAGVRTPADLLGCTGERLAGLVRSSGYHNQKARTLRVLSVFFQAPASLRAASPPARDELLSLRGIGEETADSILLYAFGRPVFIVDAYTRRLLQRIGVIGGRESCREIQALFSDALPRAHELFNEYHALIVAHAKARCRARPVCEGCPVPRCCARRLPLRSPRHPPRHPPRSRT